MCRQSLPLFAPVIRGKDVQGVSMPACSLQVSCVSEILDSLLNAFQKAYSARLTTGLPGRQCLWTSHWVSQTLTLWIKQSYSDVKLSVRICITVCFTHCVITTHRSAGTGNGSLTAEDVIYLFHGHSNKIWSVQQTDEVVCPNNMWHPYGYTASGRQKKPLKYLYYLISM